MSGERLSGSGPAVEYRPVVDAHYLNLSDERVAVAMREENAYWNLPTMRVQSIIERCKRAGHV